MYGSIMPAAWSFMLAARARGLGTCWTIFHLYYEEEAAHLLGIPYAEVCRSPCSQSPIPRAAPFGQAPKPLQTLIHWETW